MFKWQTYAAAIVLIAVVIVSYYEPKDPSLEQSAFPIVEPASLASSSPDYTDATPGQSASSELVQRLSMETVASNPQPAAEEVVYGDQIIGEFEDPDGFEFDPADGVVQVIGEPLDADENDVTYEPSDLSLPEDPDANALDGGYGVQIIGEAEEFGTPSLVDEDTIQIIGKSEEFEPPL